MDLGELKARLTAEATQMKQEIKAVKKEFVDLGDEGDAAAKKLADVGDEGENAVKRIKASDPKSVTKSISDVGEAGKQAAANIKGIAPAIAQIAQSGDRMGKLTAELDNVNAKIEIQQRKLAGLKQSYESAFDDNRKNKLLENIVNTEASILRLTQTSDKLAKEIWELEDAMNATAQSSVAAASDMDLLDQALKGIGLNADQIKSIKRNLDTVDPTSLERQLEEVEQVLKRLGLESEQIDKIKQELRQTTDEASKTNNSINALSSGIAALGAGMAMKKLVEMMKTLSNEANQLANSYRGLSVVANSFNIDSGQSISLAEELANRWGLNKGIMADVVKTYTTMNFTLEETERIITATADAAAYNRQAHLSWDEAIKQVAEGIKAGNSNLTDAAGITTNLSVMQERYAKSIGTSAAKLTEAQKIQAAYNGMLEEGAVFAGNADDAMTGLNGTQATFKSTLEETRVELGEAFVPIVEQALELLQPMIKGFGIWASENKEVVAGVTAAGIAVTGLIAILTTAITVVAALTAAFRALNIAMGPIGWTITGLSIVAAGVGAYTTAANLATDSSLEFANSVEELNQKLRESPLSRTAQDIQNLNKDMQTINDLLEKRVSLENQMANYKPNHPKYDELKKKIMEVDKELSKLGINTPDEAPKVLEEMTKQARGALGAVVELERASMRETVAHADNVRQMKALIDEYDKLNSSAKKTEEQKARLDTIIKALKKEYPDLIAQLDEENVWHLKNVDALKAYVNGEEDRVKAASQASINTLTIAQTEAKERVRLAEETLKRIEEIESGKRNSELPNFGFENPSPGLDKFFQHSVNKAKEEIRTEINNGNFAINEAKKLIEDLATGNWDEFRRKSEPMTADAKKDKKKGKVKTLAEIQQEEYQAALKWIQYKKDLNQMNEKQELAALERLEQKYKKNAEIRMDAEVRIYKLRDQMNKTSFEASSEWIEQEERRMVLAGKTEDQITAMKLAAWTRVRNRYQKDSELYKQADTQVYQAKVAQIKAAAKAEEEAAKEREKRSKETTKKALAEIEKAKKAELAALDERRKAIDAFYNEANRAIDDKERLKERNDLIAEMEKYRFATSEKGQKHFLELQEKLRQMDIEDQKQALKDERDQKLEALDKEKQDIESWYNELKEATDDLTRDLTKLYKLADDERLKSFKETNAKIIEEMRILQQELSVGTSVNAGNASVIAQMMANSEAWKSASETERRRLEQENDRLGNSQGWIRKPDGRWYTPDGNRVYHTGGIADVMNFRSGNDLMPDEIQAVLRQGETILTPQQIGSLVAASGGGPQVYVDKVVGVEMHEVTMEDEIDLRAYERYGGGEAVEILRKQLSGGGSSG